MLAQGVKKSGITKSEFFTPFKISGDFILKAEWYLMIADRATEFAVNWTSMAYLYSGCNTPASRWIHVTRSDGAIYVTSTPQLIGPMVGTEWPGIPVVTGTVGIPAKYTGTVTYDFSASPLNIPPFPKCDSWRAELINIVSGSTSNAMDFQNNNDQVQGGADVSFHEGGNTNDEIYGIFVSGQEGWLQINSASLGAYAYKTGAKGLTFDP